MASAVALCEREMRSRAHCHLFSSGLRFGQGYSMLSKAREKGESSIEVADGILTKENEDERKAVFEVEGVWLH